MGVLFHIIRYSIGNLFLGVLLTVAGILLMFVLIRSWRRDSTFTPVSYIVGVILFFFLSVQTVLLCGAVTIKSYCNEVEYAINDWVKDAPVGTVYNQAESQIILEQIMDQWPLVGYFVNLADFSGHTPETIAPAMAGELRSVMNHFILRRIGWSLFFVVIGAFIVIKSMERVTRRSYSHRYSGAGRRRRRYDD